MIKMLYFGVGVVVGAVITFAYMAEKYKNLLVEEENDGSNDEKTDKKDEKLAENGRESWKIVKKDDENGEPDAKSIFRKVSQKVGYNKMADTAVDTAMDVAKAMINPSETESPRESYTKKPYEIRPEEYSDDKLTYKKINLLLYVSRVDDTVTLVEHPEFGGQVYDDIETYVGWDNLKLIGHYEPGKVYIRNDDFQEDYSIEAIYGKYVEV